MQLVVSVRDSDDIKVRLAFEYGPETFAQYWRVIANQYSYLSARPCACC